MRLFISIFWTAVVTIGGLAGFPHGASAQKRVALVVGNSAYQHSPALPNPKNDAGDLSAVLRQQGFQVLEGWDLDKQAFDRKVRDFATALNGAEVGLFFFAGHGLQVGGQNYLVPVDAELTTAAALEFEMVKVDVVHRVMERLTNTNLLFLDACRDNPLSRNLARAMGTRSADIGRGLAAVESGIGTLISFSTQPGNVALDGTGRNSPFAAALIKHIGASKDDLSAILIDVRNDVMKDTQRKQVPWEHSALTGRFYFAAAPPLAAPVVPPPAAAPPPVAAPSPPAQSNPLSEAERVWPAVKDTSNIAVLESFASRYSTTFYADIAKARIEELKRQQAAAPPAVPSPSAQVLAEAERAWLAVKDTTNVAALETFAARYGETFYAGLAKGRIGYLKQQVALSNVPPPAPAASSSSPPAASAPWQANSAWVKLCETPSSRSQDAFGKEQAAGRYTCLTYHERMDGKTAAVIVAAGVRSVQGDMKQQFTAMVPLGVQQPPGMRIVFYPHDLWERAQKGQKIEKTDEARLRTFSMAYARCGSAGCAGETDVTPDLLNNLKNSAGALLFAIKSDGQPVGFPVPLTGFRETHEGSPTDSARYHKARNDLIQQINARQRQIDSGKR